MQSDLIDSLFEHIKLVLDNITNNGLIGKNCISPKHLDIILITTGTAYYKDISLYEDYAKHIRLFRDYRWK